ncbi:MAG: hypothetical protein ABSH23_02335 [Steroidobacteraceae bacterium]|jgi:hypothetical protein
MYRRPTAPLPNRGVVESGFELYRESFRSCAPIALVSALVSAAFGMFVLDYAHRTGTGATALEMLEVYSQPPVMAAGLLQSVLSLAFYGALIATQNAIATGAAPLPFRQALGIGFTRLGRAVIAAVLSTSLILVGLILAIVPGIYYLGALCLWPVALYAGNAGAVQSLHVSRILVRGHWWRSSSILSVAGLIVFAFSIMAGVLAGLFATLWRTDSAVAQNLVELGTALADVAVLPMVPAALVAVYQDLKLRAAGGGPAAKVAGLPGG